MKGKAACWKSDEHRKTDEMDKDRKTRALGLKARLLESQSQLGGGRRPSESRMKPMSRYAPIG